MQNINPQLVRRAQMAINMNIDMGSMFKNLFSKGSKDGKSAPPNPYTKIILAAVVALALIGSYLYFIYLPTVEANKIKEAKIAQIESLQDEIMTLSLGISEAKIKLTEAQTRHKKLTNLFHTDQELEELYRQISLLALSNQLLISKLEKEGESPVVEVTALGSDEVSASNDNDNFDDWTDDDEGDVVKQKVAYYEFKVKFEISGNYANYTKFRKSLAELKKIININKEIITVLQKEDSRGEVSVEAVLATYRLPANDSEKYISSDEVLNNEF